METTITAWEQVLDDPSLQDLPYKVETNKQGQIILSPHKLKHSRAQSAIVNLLDDLLEEGETFVEAAIETNDGVKVADVAWMSEARWGSMPEEAAAAPVAPEICVEVLSRANTADEMEGKRRLYFEQGAQEVWLCDEKGQVTFYVAGETLPAERSRLVPGFPTHIYEAS